MVEIAKSERLQIKEQIWNTIDDILNLAILWNCFYEKQRLKFYIES